MHNNPAFKSSSSIKIQITMFLFSVAYDTMKTEKSAVLVIISSSIERSIQDEVKGHSGEFI